MITDLRFHPTPVHAGLTYDRAVAALQLWEGSLPRTMDVTSKTPFQGSYEVMITKNFGPFQLRLRIFPRAFDRRGDHHASYGFTGNVTVHELVRTSFLERVCPPHRYLVADHTMLTIDEVLIDLQAQFENWFETEFLPFEAGNYA